MVFEPRLSDCSRFRPLPDNQEVFSDPDTEQSLVVEILQLPLESLEQVPAVFHFESLAKDNASLASAVNATPIEAEPLMLSRDGEAVHCIKSVCYGSQKISKFRDLPEHANDIAIFVCCLRIPALTTDIVISFNSPITICPESSSAAEVDYFASLQASRTALATFESIVHSFTVHDLSFIIP